MKDKRLNRRCPYNEPEYYAEFMQRFNHYKEREIMFSSDKKTYVIKGAFCTHHKLSRIIGTSGRYNGMISCLIERHSEPKEKFKSSKIDFDAFITEYQNKISKIHETNS